MGSYARNSNRTLNFFVTVTEKVCTKCKTLKPASDFGQKHVAPDGLRDWCNECGTDYQKRYYRRNLEKNRERKRLAMAKARLDPEKREAMRRRAQLRYKQKRDEIRAECRKEYRSRLFWAKSTKFKGVTARDLASLWRKQRGLCALTGRKMDRAAHIDHILPKAKGGGDELSNLRWVCEEANYAKGDLTDEQFVDLCGSVMRWIGERILAAERGE